MSNIYRLTKEEYNKMGRNAMKLQPVKKANGKINKKIINEKGKETVKKSIDNIIDRTLMMSQIVL